MDIKIENKCLDKLIKKLEGVGFDYTGVQRLFAENVFEFETQYFKSEDQAEIKKKLNESDVMVFDVISFDRVVIFILGILPEREDDLSNIS